MMERRGDHTRRTFPNGWVELYDYSGLGDQITVDSARVRELIATAKLQKRDRNLIEFLGRSVPMHESPFRHAQLHFRCCADHATLDQHWRYVVGSSFLEGDEGTGWNVRSLRIASEDLSFYVPERFHEAPDDGRKQGAGEPFSERMNHFWRIKLMQKQQAGYDDYLQALREGMSAQEARLFLLAYGMRQEYFWTCSLQAVAHFLDQRWVGGGNPQEEIRHLAGAVQEIVDGIYPLSLRALLTPLEQLEG